MKQEVKEIQVIVSIDLFSLTEFTRKDISVKTRLNASVMRL